MSKEHKTRWEPIEVLSYIELATDSVCLKIRQRGTVPGTSQGPAGRIKRGMVLTFLEEDLLEAMQNLCEGQQYPKVPISLKGKR